MRNVNTREIEQAASLASEMLAAGTQDKPSVFLAVSAVILSANNALDRNGEQLDALRPFAANPETIPYDAEQLQAYIAKQSGWNPPIDQCFSILMVAHGDSHEWDWVADMPTTGKQWIMWRRRVVLTFRGVSWKTASFAALLLWPFACPFAVVDRHICRRYGHADWAEYISGKPSSMHAKMPADYRRYRAIERAMAAERRTVGAVVNLGIFHWAAWDATRRETSKATSREDGSHVLLCVYNY